MTETLYYELVKNSTRKYKNLQRAYHTIGSFIMLLTIYLGQVLMVRCGTWIPEIEGSTPST